MECFASRPCARNASRSTWHGVVKAMQADGLDWGKLCRPLAGQALAEIIETEMAAAIDRQGTKERHPRC